jgi:hypothetical protein
MATVYINTKDKTVCDIKGNQIVNDGTLDDLTKAFLDAWNSSEEESE